MTNNRPTNFVSHNILVQGTFIKKMLNIPGFRWTYRRTICFFRVYSLTKLNKVEINKEIN